VTGEGIGGSEMEKLVPDEVDKETKGVDSLGMNCTPLLQCLDRLSLPPFMGW